jgi:hypothetical protein
MLTAGGATSYTWSNSLGTGNQKAVNPAVTTTYSVTGTSAGGCTNTISVVLTVYPVPAIIVNASPTAVCSGSPSTLTASGADTYVWNLGLGTGSTKTVYPATTTTYSVTGTNTLGCASLGKVVLTVYALPSVVLTANPSSITAGQSSTLTASGASTYVWSNPPGGSGTTKVVTPGITTVYAVTGMSTKGCTNTASVAVIVSPKSMQANKIPDINNPEIRKPEMKCYPNPFNEKTEICFLLPDDDHATVEIFDVTGKWIETLFNADIKGQSEYKVEFDAIKLPANIYIYRITTNNEVYTGKMILYRK